MQDSIVCGDRVFRVYGFGLSASWSSIKATFRLPESDDMLRAIARAYLTRRSAACSALLYVCLWTSSRTTTKYVPNRNVKRSICGTLYCLSDLMILCFRAIVLNVDVDLGSAFNLQCQCNRVHEFAQLHNRNSNAAYTTSTASFRSAESDTFESRMHVNQH